MNNWMKIMLLGLLVSGQIGCANRHFDVPAEKGLTGMSVSEVDKYSKNGGSKYQISNHKKNEGLAYNQMINFPVKTLSNEPIRSQEHVLQMWIAPYESQDGMYFQQGFVNVVVKPGEWIKPVVDDLSQSD